MGKGACPTRIEDRQDARPTVDSKFYCDWLFLLGIYRRMKNEEDVLYRIQQSDFLLAYFSTPECNVCKSLLLRVKKLIGNYPEVDFIYVDTETQPLIAGQYLVFAVPTLIFFSRGKELQRFSRFVSITDLRNFIERYRKLLQSENE